MAKSDTELEMWYSELCTEQVMLHKHYCKYINLREKAWNVFNFFKYGFKYFKYVKNEERFNMTVQSLNRRMSENAIKKCTLSTVYNDHYIGFKVKRYSKSTDMSKGDK